MLSENRKLVYASNMYNDIHCRSLPKIHFTALGFFLKIFVCLCVFIFVSFWSFFASLHNMKNRKKKKKKKKNNIKITTIYMVYKPVEQNILVSKFFRLSPENSV